MFKYSWYWVKSKPNGFQHAKNRPMTAVEEVCVFSKAPMGHESLLGERRMRYTPIGTTESGGKKISIIQHGRTLGARPNQVGKIYNSFTNYPNNILEYANITGTKSVHPTQKPVKLFEYLIRTYTNENELVLDNCIGSGTTAIACINSKRNYIGIELDENYYNIANKRVADRLKQIELF